MTGDPKLVLLSGPTGVGKSAAAIRLAERFDGEIINGDSLQIYRYLDIGTAKPTVAERSLFAHHLFDILEPDEPFNALEFQARADRVIAEVVSRESVPLVVGGTGLYLRALLFGLCEMPAIDPGLREMLERRLGEEGAPVLHAELAHRDPEMAAKLAPRDRTRILRALETVLATGKSISWFQQRHRFQRPRYSFLHLYLEMDRDELYRRINLRVERMIEQGLVDEVREILARGFSPELKPLRSIGYRQIIAYLEGRCSLDEAVHDIKQATRRYAKRQLTWFRHDRDAVGVVATDVEGLTKLIEDFMARGKGPHV
ncbi:MAG: tRNA (adenosine(37)-N6)-dimethylallyltransferase MiaA [Deltaproteobacteria bacterium]|nr:tRNA (adenosine(37)-N6)-dimethylallyltransferase MiaA [Deltaproteobacteria bacterium]